MNRVGRIRLLGALEAMAAEIKAGLKTEAAAEHEAQGTVPSWTAEGVTVYGSQTHDHLEVVDNDELMVFLLEEHPEMVTTVVVPRAPEQLKKWLAEKAKEGPIASQLGKLRPGQSAPAAAAIPGTVWVRGGVFITTSVKVDSGVKRELARRSRALIAGETTTDLGGVFETARLALEAE